MSCGAESNIVIFDPEKGLEIPLELNGEEAKRALKDYAYAQQLLDNYYAVSNYKESNGASTFSYTVKKDNGAITSYTVTNFEEDDGPSTVYTDNNYEADNEASYKVCKEQEAANNDADAFWSQSETMLLISLYEEHKEDFSHVKKKKFVWEIIAEKMCAKNYNRTSAKVERKWINLTRVYKSLKDNKGPKKTGRAAQNYKHFEKLDKILGNKPTNKDYNDSLDVGLESTTPKTTQEKEPSTECNINLVETQQTEQQNNEDINIPIGGAETPKKACTPTTQPKETPSRKKKNYKEEARNKRHKERLEIEREKLRIERQKVALLREYLNKNGKNNPAGHEAENDSHSD